MNDIRIMNITNGNEVKGSWETLLEAEEWIEEQDVPEMFEVMM